MDEIWNSNDITSLQGAKIMRILMFARILSLIRLLRVSRLVRFFSELEQHATIGEKYTFGIFRALSHMTGISYGSKDPPADEVELWIVMTSMVSGALMYTIMVANAAAMMSNVDAPSKIFKDKLNHLEDYMTYRKLPRELRIRINNYYLARYGGKWFDEREILSLVSKSLKEEIVNVLCARMLESTSMFKDRDPSFVNAILLQLRYEVFLEGDVIVRQNTPGDRMFFIEHGQVRVATDTFRKELCDGDYFGEICLLTRGKRVASVTALSTCRLFSLSVDSFHKVLDCFPEVRKDILHTASERHADLKNAERKNNGAPLARTETSDSKERPSTSGLNDHAEGELEEPSLADLECDLN